MIVNEQNFNILTKVNRENIWDQEPVFCFSSDIDWASEDVLDDFFNIIPFEEIKLTAFVTHESKKIADLTYQKRIYRGIHPNFLANSSHGNSFKEIAETCVRLAPEAIGFRSHRCFDVTDITHLLANDYGYKYVSNLGTTMANYIRPMLHESRLVHYPIFFEDGSHLYNELGLSTNPYIDYFIHPGIKVISFHPMNIVFNTPNIKYMREIKDSLTREQFNIIDKRTILNKRNTNHGIRNTVEEIINLVIRNSYKILSLDELYYQTIM
jgi:hypothetical protein